MEIKNLARYYKNGDASYGSGLLEDEAWMTYRQEEKALKENWSAFYRWYQENVKDEKTTKTLTEQWRDGTLERGYYYYKTKAGAMVVGYQCFGLKFPYDYNHNTIDSVVEVLTPVPTYWKLMQKTHTLEKLQDFCELLLVGEKQEWENVVKRGDRKEMAKWLNERKNKTVDRLQKKLDIATKALKEYTIDNWKYEDEYNSYPLGCGGWCYAEEALKEIDLVGTPPKGK